MPRPRSSRAGRPDGGLALSDMQIQTELGRCSLSPGRVSPTSVAQHSILSLTENIDTSPCPKRVRAMIRLLEQSKTPPFRMARDFLGGLAKWGQRICLDG